MQWPRPVPSYVACTMLSVKCLRQATAVLRRHFVGLGERTVDIVKCRVTQHVKRHILSRRAPFLGAEARGTRSRYDFFLFLDHAGHS